MNIIFIEGIAGSGKSSTAHWLGLHLKKLGRTVHWYFEQDADHPIYPSGQAQEYDAEIPLREQMEIRRSVLSRWKELAESIAGTNQIVILEGGFLQAVIDHYLLLNLQIAEAFAHVLEVESIFESLDALMIYLYQSDVGAALVKIRLERGEEYADLLVKLYKQSPFGRVHGISDYQDVIKAIAATRQFTDTTFEKLRMRKIAIDTSIGVWKRYYDAIADILSVPPIDIPSDPPGNAGMLVGKYQSIEHGDEFSVIADKSGLYLSNQARVRLVPKSESEFYGLGTRLQVKFETDDHGVAHALKLFGEGSNPLEARRRI